MITNSSGTALIKVGPYSALDDESTTIVPGLILTLALIIPTLLVFCRVCSKQKNKNAKLKNEYNLKYAKEEIRYNRNSSSQSFGVRSRMTNRMMTDVSRIDKNHDQNRKYFTVLGGSADDYDTMHQVDQEFHTRDPSYNKDGYWKENGRGSNFTNNRSGGTRGGGGGSHSSNQQLNVGNSYEMYGENYKHYEKMYERHYTNEGRGYLYSITILTAIIECALALLLIVYPEINNVFGGYVNSQTYHNPMYERLWASLILTINIYYIFSVWYKNHLHLYKSRNKKMLENQTNELHHLYIFFGIHAIKSAYYIGILLIGFVLTFIETCISNHYTNTNLSITAVIVTFFVLFCLTLFVAIIHIILTLNNYKKIQ